MESQKPMAPKPVAPAAKIKKEEKISNIRGIKNAFIVILCCAAAAVCIFLFGMGYSGNFEGGTTEGHPLNLAGTVYKGGFIVPILMTLLLTVIVLSIERWIALSSATGKGNTTKFVADIKADLAANNIDAAMKRCKDPERFCSISCLQHTRTLQRDGCQHHSQQGAEAHYPPQRG